MAGPGSEKNAPGPPSVLPAANAVASEPDEMFAEADGAIVTSYVPGGTSTSKSPLLPLATPFWISTLPAFESQPYPRLAE